jgi:hypothetical protein
LLGHRKLESVIRYLGIEVDDALELAKVKYESPGCGDFWWQLYG